MLNSNIQAVTPEPIDVASVHFYNVKHSENQLFGVWGPYNPDALIKYKRAADLAGKPLFVGEYMDDLDTYPAETPGRNFARGVIGRLIDQHIPLSAAWLWESWWSPADIRPNANPLTDSFIWSMAVATALGNTTSRTVDATPPNSGFDLGTGGLPSSWTVTGTSGYSVSLVSESFNGQAVRLAAPAGGQLRIESSLVQLGLTAPSSAVLIARAAAFTDSTITDPELCVYGYTTLDGSGTPIIGCTTLTGNPNQFLVNFASASVPGVKSARVRLVANGGGFVKFDDVVVSLIY